MPPLPILCVEDEAILAMIVEDTLHGAGFACTIATGVTAALELIDRQRFAGAVVDLNLGNFPAWPVLDRLVERGIPFVLSTGDSLSTLPERFRGQPVAHKPYDLDRLVEAVIAIARPD